MKRAQSSLLPLQILLDDFLEELVYAGPRECGCLEVECLLLGGLEIALLLGHLPLLIKIALISDDG